MKLQKRTIKRVVSYSVANYLYTAINAVSNIFVSNILGPVNNGVISYYNAINTNIDQIAYSTFRSSLERNIPQIEDYKKKIIYAQQAFTLNLYTSLAFSLIFIIIGLCSSESLTQISAYYMSILNLVRSCADFYRIWIRALDKIPIVASIMFISALFIPVFAVAFSYYFALDGFWIGRILIALLSFGCFFYASKHFFKIVSVKINFLKSILISGGEIVLFALCISGIQTIDKYFIKECIGLEQLGYYAIGSMVFTMLMLVPSSIIGAVYPRFVGMINADLKSLVLKYSLVIELLSLFVAIAAYICMPYIIQFAMPKYFPSVPIIRIMLIAFVSYACIQLKYIDIVRKKKMRILIINSIIAFLLCITAFAVLSRVSTDINDYAWCTTFCFILISYCVNYSWGKIYNYNIINRLQLGIITIAPFIIMFPLYLSMSLTKTIIIIWVLSVVIYILRYKFIKF